VRRINLLKSLSEEAKEEIFEKVFIEEDTVPLTNEERQAVMKAEEEFKSGETIRWPLLIRNLTKVTKGKLIEF